MGFDIESYAKKTAASRSSQGSNYLRDGSGVLVVRNITFDEKQEGATFVAEMEVVSSKDDPTHPEVRANAPGSTVSNIQQPDIFDSAFGNIKAYIENLEGGELDETAFVKTLKGAVSDAQPYRGVLIAYETYRKWTKKKDKELTLPRWKFLSETQGNSTAEIQARRAVLEGKTVEKVLKS